MKEKVRFHPVEQLLRQPRFFVPSTLLLLATVLVGLVATAPAANPPPGPAEPAPARPGAYPPPGGAAGLPLARATGVVADPGADPPSGNPPPAVEFHRSTVQSGYVWLIETVDPQPYTGVGTSLALDGQDRPHIAYNRADTCDLRYAYFDGTHWVTTTVDSFGLTGVGPSLALDAAGGAHIAYRLSGDYMDLLYAQDNGAGSDGETWITTTVDTIGDTGIDPSLVVDAAGHPRISYNRDSCLMYAHDDGSGWQVETVACGTGWYGWCSSLELDAQGAPRISYQAAWPNQDLMYAWYDGTQWQHVTVDSTGMVGYDTSLALDSQGRPHISYYDDTLGALKYAWHDGTVWHIEVVDSGGVGQYTSLVLDTVDHPHISYYDETHYGLRYASFDGTRWLTETVDAAGDYTGQLTSLALDSQGRPQISYRGSMYWLRYARLVALPYTVFLPWIER